jgi:hypothetical protein
VVLIAEDTIKSRDEALEQVRLLGLKKEEIEGGEKLCPLSTIHSLLIFILFSY